ncbi:MAG: (2Fe-2S)-binding protein [Ignavibacteriae bacterium]|nr:(2Fe-2S)-binding protein [Ignavibacteriota bacterium]
MQTTINKKVYNIPDELKDVRLTDYLREYLDLTGVKNACEMRACGACAILVNDKSMRICHATVKDVENCDVLTIEGMENEDGTLHPLQQAFVDYGAVQCGFCTPGMVLTAHALLLSNNSPTREQIRKALQSNLCRCTGYQQIVDAIEAASVYYK